MENGNGNGGVEATGEQIVVHIDSDNFEVQVLAKYEGISPQQAEQQPMIVMTDSIICSLNTPAKAKGLRRGFYTPSLARKRCPNIRILKPPVKYDKPDKTYLRNESDNIYDSLEHNFRLTMNEVIQGYKGPVLEKASVDEFYVDLTEEVKLAERFPFTVHNIRKENAKRKVAIEGVNKRFKVESAAAFFNNNMDGSVPKGLLRAAYIVEQVLDAVKVELGYTLSAGVSTNKLLAKMACNVAKPNGLSILPDKAWNRVKNQIDFDKLPGLGGKIGRVLQQRCHELNQKLRSIGDVERLPNLVKENLIMNGVFLDKLRGSLQGQDDTKVKTKFLQASHRCGRKLNPPMELQYAFIGHECYEDLIYCRLFEMGEHLLYENDRNKRVAKSLTILLTVERVEPPRFRNRFNIQRTIKLEVDRSAALVQNLRTAGADSKEVWGPFVEQFGEKFLDSARSPLKRIPGAINTWYLEEAIIVVKF